MAKFGKIDISSCSFISVVKENPVLWNCCNDEYKLAERKPIIWDNVAAQVSCDRCTLSQFSYVSSDIDDVHV